MSSPLLDLYRRYFKLVHAKRPGAHTRKIDDLCEQISHFPLAEQVHARVTIELEIANRRIDAVKRVCQGLEQTLLLSPKGVYVNDPMAHVIRQIREALNGDT